MGWTLAAAQSDPSFPAFPFILGLILIGFGFAATKTGVLTRRRRRDYLSDWLLTTGYQGDKPRPRGINREDSPFDFYYIILCMYLFGALLILTAIVESLFF